MVEYVLYFSSQTKHDLLLTVRVAMRNNCLNVKTNFELVTFLFENGLFHDDRTFIP